MREEGLIQVSGEGTGRHQQLGVGGGDRCRDDSRQQQSADSGGEEAAGHGNEHQLLAAGLQQLRAHDHSAEIGDEHGGEQGDDDPNDGHDGGLLDHGGLLDGHEAHQNVGHTEIAQAPAQAAEDVLPAGVEQANAERALRHRAGGGIGVLIDSRQRGRHPAGSGGRSRPRWARASGPASSAYPGRSPSSTRR